MVYLNFKKDKYKVRIYAIHPMMKITIIYMRNLKPPPKKHPPNTKNKRI